MKMSDVVSSLGLSVYPIVALVLFLLVFAGVVYRVSRRGAREELSDAARLPLHDEHTAVSEAMSGGRGAKEAF